MPSEKKDSFVLSFGGKAADAIFADPHKLLLTFLASDTALSFIFPRDWVKLQEVLKIAPIFVKLSFC